MMAALTSLYTQRPVPAHTAMTGEITLSGLVLPIGGVKEKVLAARRGGIKRIIIPKHNLQDLDELQPEVRQDIEFIPVETVDELLKAVFPDDRSRHDRPHPKQAKPRSTAKRARSSV